MKQTEGAREVGLRFSLHSSFIILQSSFIILQSSFFVLGSCLPWAINIVEQVDDNRSLGR
jgi:hypothetical protein